MERSMRNGLTPAEEDPVLHQYLTTLPSFTPATSLFEERVLARVRRPVPGWLRQVHGAVRGFARTGRVWLVLGPLAVGSVISITAAVIVATVYASDVGRFFTWLWGEGLPTAWSHTRADFTEAAAAVSLTFGTLASSAGILLLCGWGLYRTARVRPR